MNLGQQNNFPREEIIEISNNQEGKGW